MFILLTGRIRFAISAIVPIIIFFYKKIKQLGESI